MRALTPTGMSTSGERETWAPCLMYRGVDLYGELVPMRIGPDPYIRLAAAREAAKGRVYVQKQMNEWRREVGMRPRHLEVNCPDEFTNWEDAPAPQSTPIYDAVVRKHGKPPL